MRLKFVGIVALTLLASAVQAGAAFAQETRVNPRALGELRAWDRRVTADIRSGDLRRRSVRADTLVAGRVHERFDQYFNGVRVYGADIARQRDAAGQTVSMFGTLYDGIAISTAPALAQADVKQRIEALGGARLGETRQPELFVLPLENGTYALTWYGRIFSKVDGTLTGYFIDAQTGAIVKAVNELQTQSAVGRGAGVLGDEKKVSASSNSGRFIAIDGLRPPDILTFDLKGDLNRAIDFLNGDLALGLGDVASDSDNVWNDAAAVDGHVYAGFTYDYYFKRLGRRGLDNDNIRLLSLVHSVRREDIDDYPFFIVADFYLNAFYFGNGVMVYGEGLPSNLRFDGQSWDYLAGGLDVVAHELTHGVTGYTSGLIYENESGALNEAFSDMVGASVEFFFQEPGNGLLRSDWLIGEDVIRPGGLRNMRDPASYGYPDHYARRYTGPDDGGGVHTNSAIPNLAFYLAIEGGPHPRTGAGVTGVGFANRDQIEKVFYRAFTEMLTSRATFAQARAATVQAARDLYGVNSAAERAVTQAWSAVGVN